MAKDIHNKPFDDGTIIKLTLYERYLKEWLPVFLSKTPSQFHTINIFDFFAGPGKDINNQKGSPLITIDLVQPYFDVMLRNQQHVHLHFNDKSIKKVKQLRENINSLPFDLAPLKINYYSEDFQKLFNENIPLISKRDTANFLFLDQSGVKHITDDVFKTIISLPTTDFIFFISSSTLSRFSDHPTIGKYIRIDQHNTISAKYYHIHRRVLEHYRNLVPQDKVYYLAPFSIKKNANIYGLIFGTGHLRGMDKFLTQCWKIDPQTGESNFDIDDDRISPSNPYLFGTLNKPRKLEAFENDMATEILNKNIETNKDIYEFALLNGYLAKHAREVVIKLIKEKKLPNQKVNISYNSCIKENDVKKIIYN